MFSAAASPSVCFQLRGRRFTNSRDTEDHRRRLQQPRSITAGDTGGCLYSTSLGMLSLSLSLYIYVFLTVIRWCEVMLSLSVIKYCVFLMNKNMRLLLCDTMCSLLTRNQHNHLYLKIFTRVKLLNTFSGVSTWREYFHITTFLG